MYPFPPSLRGLSTYPAELGAKFVVIQVIYWKASFQRGSEIQTLWYMTVTMIEKRGVSVERCIKSNEKRVETRIWVRILVVLLLTV